MNSNNILRNLFSRNTLQLLLPIFVLLLCANASAQTTFEKRYYSGSGGSVSNGIAKTLDGNYVLSGYNKAGTSNRDWNLVKVDSLGSLISSWQYNLGVNSYKCNMKTTADSGYIVYGSTGSGYGSIMKLDKNGAVTWAKIFTSGGVVNDVIQLENGQYIVSCPTACGIMKMNSAGDIIWAKTATGLGSTGKILHTSDDYYIISGDNGPGAVIAKFDTAGNALWGRYFYDGNYAAYGSSVCQTTDLGFVLLAQANYKKYSIKVDANGTKVWSYNATTSCTYPGIDIVALPNNETGYFVTTSCVIPDYLYFNKLSSDGATVTLKSISAPNSENYQVGSIYKNPDGSLPPGMVFCAGTYDSGSGLYEMDLIKLTQSLSGCNVITSTPQSNSSYGFGQYNLSFAGSTIPTMTTISPVFSTALVSTIPVCSLSPLSITASSSSANILCNGQCAGTATVTPSGGQTPYTYLWSPGGKTTANATGLCAGTYTLTVTAGSSTATATVSVTQPAALTGNASASPSTFCNGECTTLNITAGGGTPGYAYVWMPGNLTTSSVSVCPTTNASYTCTITDGNNCSTIATNTVTVNSMPALTTTLNGIVITANQSGASYQWLNCSNNSTIVGATNQSYTATVNGNYAVVVTLGNCSDTSACVNINTTGIYGIVNDNQLIVYPNPTNGVFTIKSADEEIYSIINELGQIIQQVILNDKNNYTSNIENLNNGIYFLIGFNSNHLTKQKVMVAK